VIPAAGTGARLGAAIPKQYLTLAGRPMIRWSVEALLAVPWIERVLVVAAPEDPMAASLLAGLARVEVLARGGVTRRDSVLAGLAALAASGARRHDWVLVHDAARPALQAALLERLRTALADSPVGGLLALPASDTVKHADREGRVAATLERDRLWLAQTPQMFRLGLLTDALAAHAEVTDESGAVERAGHAPLLVEGARANFKVTTVEDLELMRLVLEQRRGEPR